MQNYICCYITQKMNMYIHIPKYMHTYAHTRQKRRGGDNTTFIRELDIDVN